MAHIFDTKASLLAQTGTSISLAYTAGAGATLLILGLSIVGITARAGGSPTFAGIPMVQAAPTQVTGGTTASCELWYLTNPPTASAQNIVVPNTGALNVSLVASTYSAAAGLTSVFDVASQGVNTGTGTVNPALSITPSVTGSAIISVISTGGGTLTASQTLLFAGTASTIRYGGEYALNASAGAVTMNWTNATSTRWVTIAAAFRESSKNNSMLMGAGT